MEFRMDNNRLNIPLLIRQSFLRSLSVPFTSTNFQISFADIKNTMRALK